MIDYQAIMDNLTVEHVESILKKLGIEYEDKGAFLLMPTYCHNHMSEDASKKLYFYKNSKIFMCYTECGAQTIFKFLKNFYEAQGIEYEWYNDIYRVIIGDNQSEGLTTPKYQSLRNTYGLNRRPGALNTYNDGVLDCFVKKYPVEWLNDGISKEAMDKYDIRFSISQNKIIIPHRDVNGALVGIRGRALNAWEVENVGKYMPVQIENTWYKHPLGLNLYGLYENKQAIRENGICYVFEAEKSVLQMESFSIPNCGVAICGSQFNKFQLGLLIRECSPHEIILCLDTEELPGETKYFDKLWNICNKYKEYCAFSFVYDRKGLTKLKDSPTDNGEEIFKKLIATRVKMR